MFNFGGIGSLAGGVAAGMAKSKELAMKQQQMDLHKQYIDQQGASDSRESDLHSAKMDEINYNKAQRGKNDAAMSEVSQFLNPQPATQPPVQAAAGLSGTDAPVSATQAPGLAAAPPPQTLAPNTAIQKAVLTSDFLSDPDKLNGVAAIFAKHGLTDKMMPWLNQAAAAKKGGIIDAMGAAIGGDGAGAANALRQGGIPVEGDLKPASKDNTQWTGIVGGKQQTFDVRKLGAMADPMSYLKNQDDQQKQSLLNNKTIAETNYINGAKTALTQQQAATSASGGLRGTADRPEKIDAAIKRRDTTLDALSSATGDDGKPFVDPKKRMLYSGLSVDAEQAVTDSLGRDLSAKEHHKLTDLLRTAPIGNAQGMAQWGAQLQHTFGIQQPQQAPAPAQQQAVPQPAPGGLAPAGTPAPAPEQAAPPPPQVGGLEMWKQKAALQNQLSGIRSALANPNLSTQQKAQLSLQANQIMNQIQGR